MTFVHDDRDFDDLLQIVAAARRLAPGLIEKDYWVTRQIAARAMAPRRQGRIVNIPSTSSNLGFAM